MMQYWQGTLFKLLDPSQGTVELFPEVWGAAEMLVSPDPGCRLRGLQRLVELEAPRLSPLVAYLVATRLDDPDLLLRTRIVQVLGSLFHLDSQGAIVSDEVRITLSAHLSQMRERMVYGLLQVAEVDDSASDALAHLFNLCPNAGHHLVDILVDRKAPLAIRTQAVVYLGRVGYLDALPALQRLAARLETRQSGQQIMSFAPPTQPDEADLLPFIQEAVALLQAP